VRLLFLHSIAAGSGANVHIDEFTAAATRQGAEIRCVGQATQSVRVQGRRVATPLPRLVKDVIHLSRDGAFRRRADAAARDWRPDAVYFRGALYMGYGRAVARAHGLPLFYELNTPFPGEHLEFHGGHFGGHARRVERANREAARRIFTVSRQLADILVADGAPSAKLVVVPNGVTLERFDPAPRPDDGQLRFGFVGSLQVWHGVEVMLDAFAEVLAALPHAHLHIAGDGPLAGAVAAARRRSPHADRLHLHGPLPHAEIPAFLQGLDVLLAPYPALPRFYFSPLKLFEYLAAGRVVAASALGQIADVVQDDVDGCLLPPGDPRPLARCCLELAADPERRRRLAAAARAKAAAHTWDANARVILDHIRADLAAQGG
jgi:glycosyltransferase involved in cell wall biosynthesis